MGGCAALNTDLRITITSLRRIYYQRLAHEPQASAYTCCTPGAAAFHASPPGKIVCHDILLGAPPDNVTDGDAGNDSYRRFGTNY